MSESLDSDFQDKRFFPFFILYLIIKYIFSINFNTESSIGITNLDYLFVSNIFLVINVLKYLEQPPIKYYDFCEVLRLGWHQNEFIWNGAINFYVTNKQVWHTKISCQMDTTLLKYWRCYGQNLWDSKLDIDIKIWGKLLGH